MARDTSGRVLESVLGEVLLAGAKPIPEMELARVDKVIADLAIESDVAMEVLSQVWVACWEPLGLLVGAIYIVCCSN